MMGIALIVMTIVMQFFTVVYSVGIGKPQSGAGTTLLALAGAITAPVLAYIAGGL
jgi:hypothetical protein